MSRLPMGARGLMSLLFHGSKLSEALEVAWRSGLLARLDDAGETGVSLDALASSLEMVPGRLYKLLDCLEALALVRRTDGSSMGETMYAAHEPLTEAARLVFDADSIERDRDRQPWRALEGRLGEVLRGAPGIPTEDFAWPPKTDEQAARFAASMAAGVPPIAESFRRAPGVWGDAQRVLDVGGGNGTLARRIAEHTSLHVDVLELPELAPLAQTVFAESAARDRLGFVAGDAFDDPLPEGYDAMLFVRILHDWPQETARALLEKAARRVDRILICEELRTPERLAVQTFWSWFLIGVDGCVSRLREWDRYVEWLSPLGFECRLESGPFDIGVAVRAPGS